MKNKAQTVLEYLVLFTVVASLAIIAIRPGSDASKPDSIIEHVQASSEANFKAVTRVIAGEDPTPIDGAWCAWTPPDDACAHMGNYQRRECACPPPQYGGKHCTDSTNPNTQSDPSGNAIKKPCSGGAVTCDWLGQSDCQGVCGTTGIRTQINCSCETDALCGPPTTSSCQVPSCGCVGLPTDADVVQCPGTGQDLTGDTTFQEVSNAGTCSGDGRQVCEYYRCPAGQVAGASQTSCSLCGNGQVDAGEQCDESSVNNANCTNCVCDPNYVTGPGGSCVLACGNWNRETGEDCDPGPSARDDCDIDCTCRAGYEVDTAMPDNIYCLKKCGNGILNPEDNEQCDGVTDCLDTCTCRVGTGPDLTAANPNNCTADPCGNRICEINDPVGCDDCKFCACQIPAVAGNNPRLCSTIDSPGAAGGGNVIYQASCQYTSVNFSWGVGRTNQETYGFLHGVADQYYCYQTSESGGRDDWVDNFYYDSQSNTYFVEGKDTRNSDRGVAGVSIECVLKGTLATP